MGRRVTIHHQHDVTGGQFLGLLSVHAGFSLIILGFIGWIGFLVVQDWFSGRTLDASQYQLTISPATARFTGVETMTYEQPVRIVNRSDVTLTRVRLERRTYTCPAGSSDLSRCNKVEQKPMFIDVQLAPGESATHDTGARLMLPGTVGTETLRVQNKLIAVEGDADKEA